MAGKGLPKKYAKMGFKKGWREYKKTKRRTKSKRRSPPKKRSYKRSSRGRSNPSGGRSTSKMSKFGKLYKDLRTTSNIFAPAANPFSPRFAGAPIEAKAKRAFRNYFAYDLDTADFNFEYATPTWAGIATSMVNDYFDRKTGTAKRMSKGHLLDIAKEAIPIAEAHFTASGTGNYAWVFADRYNKATCGYSLDNHDHDLGRVTPYATAKGLVWLARTFFSPFLSKVNERLPKGLNL